MWLVWFAFVVSVALIGGGLWNVSRRARGAAVVDFVKRPVPWQFDAAFLFLGLVGVVSSAPGLFLGEPNWAIDHVSWLISKVAGNAA